VKPKSHKEFKDSIADEVGVHPQVVDDFITFYYGKLRKKLSSLAYPRINVDGLGTFHLRKNKLEKAILKNKSLLGNIAKRTYNGFAKSEDIQNNIIQMEAAMQQLEEDIKNKKEFRNGKK
jgi:nucleoid DNA-binding protein